jgi:hypothetical protein
MGEVRRGDITVLARHVVHDGERRGKQSWALSHRIAMFQPKEIVLALKNLMKVPPFR